MLKKLYKNSKIFFALTWIIVYCVLASVGDNLSAQIGILKCVTLPILTGLSIVLFVFLKKNGLLRNYGLCKPQIPASNMLFYIPLILLLTTNLWYGITLNVSPLDTCLYILSMVLVGFLEEMIFRGLLFNAMAENDVKSAVVVSSVTFGIGHIINLINGSGAQLLPNILQVIYAIAVGFAFVMIYIKSKSLIPCIVTHSLFNALSVFSNEAIITNQKRIISCVWLSVIAGTYALYLFLSIKNEKINEKSCGAVLFTRENDRIKYIIIQSNEGIYGFPKGHMETGESETETALREISEETGLSTTLLDGFRLEVNYTFIRDGRKITKDVIYFLAEYCNQVPTVQESELKNIYLMDYNEALSMLQFEESKEILTKAHKYLMNL